jgi:hypothetical protein
VINIIRPLSWMMFARRIHPQADTDPRFNAAADCMGRIMRTLPLVDDATLARLAAVDRRLLTSLIVAQLEALAFEAPTVVDAVAFFDRLEPDLDARCKRLH